jgi:HAMP domain.
LAIATEKVEQEDFSVRVIPRTKDEVGLLAYSFNKMVQGLEERERMKDAFGRFVNKEIAEKH